MDALADLVGMELLRTEAFLDYHQVFLAGCTINIYNDAHFSTLLTPPAPGAAARTVVRACSEPDFFRLELSDGAALQVDLRPDAWKGPEALGCYFADGRIVIV